MTVSRRVVLLIVLYITVDLSFASVPGAFVFEAGESIETLQMGRGRHVAPTGPAVVPPRERTSAVVVDIDLRPSIVPRAIRALPLDRGHGSPASSSEPPPLSEDSH